MAGFARLKFELVRTLLGALLFVSAAMKWHQMVFDPLLDGSLFGSRWLLLLTLELELGLAIWLCWGNFAIPLWWTAVACFAALAVVSLTRGLGGATSCGCFGSASVSPWIALAIDLVALVLLLAARPAPGQADPSAAELAAEEPPGRLRPYLAATGAAILLAAAAVSAIVADRSRLLADGMTQSGDVWVLEPNQWKGKPLPVLDDTDLGERLRAGRWELILYHRDCSRCQALIRRRLSASHADQDRLALVEVPPYGAAAGADDPPWLTRGHLTDRKEWFVATPVTIRLDEGTVVEVATDE